VGRDVEAIRDEKARLLRAIAPIDPARIVRGQYRGYRQEPGVSPTSTVETFVALELRIDTWRWADVPFFLRAGKCMPRTVTEVIFELKKPPRDIFGEHDAGSNYVRFRLGPDVHIAIGVRAKRPGLDRDGPMGQENELIAGEDVALAPLPYERLLDDATRGEPMLFARQDEIEAQWRVVDPVLGDAAPVQVYDRGTWGPDAAGRLFPRCRHSLVLAERAA
jgi:glucose-6-phosphate 1-dehydrogenase